MLNSGKNWWFLSSVTLKFEGWHWKSIGHLFYTTWSFVCHFLAINEFKLELQSVNTQFRSKLVIFCSMWSWNLMNDVENNRAPVLCYFKLCSPFQRHWWIQSGVTVRKLPIWVQIGDFLSCVTLKFDGWPSKKLGHLFYATSSFVQHFLAIGELKLELQSGCAPFGSNLTLFRVLWPWNVTDDLQK